MGGLNWFLVVVCMVVMVGFMWFGAWVEDKSTAFFGLWKLAFFLMVLIAALFTWRFLNA